MAAHDDELLPSAVERHIARSRIDDRPAGAIPASSLQRERDVVSYLRGSLMPRYMERLRDIHVQMRRHLEELRRLRDELPPEEFRAVLESWDFSETNELIRRHNAWYPIERDLPMDPRTGEYLPVAGRSYKRPLLDADWALRELGPYAPDS
jgi:hypothetical protein